MAYTVSIQRGDQPFAGTDKAMEAEFRVTEIYRREADGWKLVHLKR
jgi:ketosteroid isomerase-like protein